jgi:hypothetical protein
MADRAGSRHAMRRARTACLLVALALPACVDHLPDQDMRILTAAPAARLRAEDLWNDYAADPKNAAARYFGKAVIVTGNVTTIGSDAPTDRFVLFGQPKEFGVRANLLDEQAAAILERAGKQPRLSLKCFCEGLDGNVVLKSCVTPSVDRK